MIVVVIEGSALIVQMISVVTGVMGSGVPVYENFVVAINLRLVHVLRRQKGESAHGQGQNHWNEVESPHRKLS